MTAPNFRIVVGFDGSEGSEKALRWAAGEARLRSAKMAVVRAFTPGEFITNDEMAHVIDKKVEEDVYSILGDNPGFELECLVERGRASKVLVELARGADMLVVGSRGHGGFTGLLIGSVSQQVATHTSAPVVVIVKD